MSSSDFVEQYYERIATDPEYRSRLLADPVAVVSEEFGYSPGPDLKIEVIEQAEDTIIMIVPPRPEAGEDIAQELTRVTEQSLDLLFSSGIGGFFIPDDTQKWVLREMRLASLDKAGSGVSQK
ncbi:nitrile hydratase subunit alpha [Mesorhizobium sp. BR1-1-16]|uniref:nitrile hydratase subunit alpha n=1 Tax=Mesorhizobium sp. BR1-1-16 TaxID=2876653 RepID=UPI001CC95F2B|nr:nitrile hydratase subunit alpha [Mesorhizobium sp. BR1-1-16]MBZ9939216.1 nitrile hydratase subunit alpha [Mesorhizobium sp. BR1-1-16]